MKGFLAGIGALVLVIVGLTVYLGPDGMKSCGARPDASVFDCQKVDAIVTISGGDTTARTAQAIDLYKNGWSSTLVFSGAAADKSGPSNAQVMKRQALTAGVPESAILLDTTSENTSQNAANTNSIFEEHNIHSVILVTSAYHQRRAGLEFGKRAGSSVRIINHPVAQDKQWSSLWWTTPSGWYLALSEFFKIVVFYMGGTR